MCQSGLYTIQYTLLSDFTLSHSGIHKILCSTRAIQYDLMQYEIMYCIPDSREALQALHNAVERLFQSGEPFITWASRAEYPEC